MIKWNPGFVYLLNKTGDPKRGKVTTNFSVWVPDMLTVEKALHKLFSDSHYESLSKVPKHKHMQRLCKIGLTKNPVDDRVYTIDKNWKSGHTEWFALNWAERWVCRWWMRWYNIRWFVIFMLIVLGLGVPTTYIVQNSIL